MAPHPDPWKQAAREKTALKRAGQRARQRAAEQVLAPKIICQGGWNCMADVASDLRYLDPRKSPTDYKNAHGNACEALMTKSGLADTFRLLAYCMQKD